MLLRGLSLSENDGDLEVNFFITSTYIIVYASVISLQHDVGPSL